MAIVTGPLNSSEARGSVGDLTYNTWRGKHTVKRRCGPKIPDSGNRYAALENGQYADSLWKLLSQDQRDEWIQWAASLREPHWTGQDKRLTGHNWYVRITVRRRLLGNAPLLHPPNYTITHAILDLYATPNSTYIVTTWTFEDFPDAGDYFVQLYLAGPHSIGRHATIHDAIRQGEAAFGDENFFVGDLAAGTYTVFCRLMHETGLVSPWQSDTATLS
jgi:hypothetical protein